MEEYTGKFDTNTPALEIPDQLKGLFADPPLLEGEHPELYGGLLTAAIDERTRRPAKACVSRRKCQG